MIVGLLLIGTGLGLHILDTTKAREKEKEA
jgi:hypothetical protein